MPSTLTIAYTKTDEAPALATRSLLPILRAFATGTGIDFELKDISLAGRILSHFPDSLEADQRVPDALSELGELATRPEANIVKLPNVSASIPQLQAAVKELQTKGFPIPDFPTDPQTQEEKEVRATYAKVLGSAVNPVLREGNSDRRVAKPVKEYAQKNPHPMGVWASDSKSHVAHMSSGDFYGSEKSFVIKQDSTVRIEFVDSSGESKILKDEIALLEGEVIDASVMNRNALRSFLAEQLDRDTLIAGLRIARRMGKANAMAKYCAYEMNPGAQCQSDEELLDYARGTGATTYHVMGTCKMGPDDDPMAVVDERLCLRGLQGLRVVDASIMPTMPSGNINAPVIMLAEKAAHMMIQDSR